MMELLAKIFGHVRKRLHLRCLTGFWICLCYVRDNYLSVSFPTQPFLLLSLWWFKAFYFSTFPIFHKTHETHKPVPQLAIKSCWKDGWNLPICQTLSFNVVSEHKENESSESMYFVEPFYLFKFSIWKSMHDNKNDDFFNHNSYLSHLSLYNIDFFQ